MTKYTSQQIYDKDGGVFTQDNPRLQHLVAKVLERIPSYVVDGLMEKCLIVCPSVASGYIPNDEIGNKGVIILNESILSSDINKVTYTILHECAHCWLGHNTPHWTRDESIAREYMRNEGEATDLVHQWLLEG